MLSLYILTEEINKKEFLFSYIIINEIQTCF